MDTQFLKGKKILVVDDVKINYVLIKGLLKNEGVDVLWAEDGFQAVHRYKTEHPDLILMDYHMPGKNGYEAAEEIKKEQESLPIICQTTDSVTPLLVDKKKVFNDIIIKPINKNNLLKKIYENMA